MSSDHLSFLQSLSEEELTELVIIPLLASMDYKDVRYTHGVLERGKDIVFVRDDPLSGPIYMCAVVKAFALTGAVSGNRSIREVLFQVEQALTQPFIDPLFGLNVNIQKVFVITSFSISEQSKDSIKGLYDRILGKVEFVSGEKLLALVLKHIPSLLSSLSDPHSRYLQRLSCRFTDSHVLTQLGANQDMTVFDMYTGGTLSLTTLDEARFVSFASPLNSTGRVSALDALRAARCCAIIADVGAGKTTMLQKLLRDVLGGHMEPHSAARTIPLFIPLSVFTVNDLRTFNTFTQRLTRLVRDEHGLQDFDISDSKRYVFLLDGFDELPGNEHNAADYLSSLVSQAAGAIITSRPHRIPTLTNSFTLYRLNPFSEAEIAEFLAKWMPSNEARRKDILAQIRKHPSLHAFCRTPLILTLYAILLSRPSLDVLPQRLTDIYSSIVQLFLGEWDHLRHVTNYFSKEFKTRICEIIAYRNHKAGRRVCSHQDCLQTIREISALLGVKAHEQVVLSEIFFRSCLLRRTKVDEYEFVHLSFQEFLCALHLKRSLDTQEVQEKLSEGWWEGVLRYYFGLTRSMDGLRVRGAIRKNKFHGLMLARHLLEADFTSQDKRAEILRLLANDLLSVLRVNEEEVDLCRRLGDMVFEVLVEAVGNGDNHAELTKLFKLLGRINTNRAARTLREQGGLLKRLNFATVADIVCECVCAVHHEDGREFVWGALDILAGSVNTMDVTDLEQLVDAAHRTRKLIDIVRKEVAATRLPYRDVAVFNDKLSTVCVPVRNELMLRGKAFASMAVMYLPRLLVAISNLPEDKETTTALKQGVRVLRARLAVVHHGEFGRRRLGEDYLIRCHNEIAENLSHWTRTTRDMVAAGFKEAQRAYETSPCFHGIVPFATCVIECGNPSSGCGIAVEKGSAAEKAGLCDADVIYEVNGEMTVSQSAFTEVMVRLALENQYKCHLVRGNLRLSLMLTVAPD